MGDPNRNQVFATFIKRNFHKAKSVLVVADGKGGLARSLANKGFEVKVIENKPRFEGRVHKKIEYQKGWFTPTSKIDADLVVAMHPDEATGPVVMAATKQNKPFAVVPCCCVGIGSEGMSRNHYNDWIKKLSKIAKGCRSTTLKISGKNVVLYKH